MAGDFEDQVRQAALSILGEQLRQVWEGPRVALRLGVAADFMVWEYTRAVAVGALARAMGDDWLSSPWARQLRIDSEWAQGVILRARGAAVPPPRT